MSDTQLFVAYCTSGLGNRLRPLAAAIAYCHLTGRELRVYWDSITPNGCLTPFERLYEAPITPITLDEIAAFRGRSVGLFTEKGPGHGVQREAERFGRDQLLGLSQQSAPQHAQALQLDDPNEVVIVYDNDYLACVPRDKSIAALRSLRPCEPIRTKVLAQAAALGLTLQTPGVHARGTDFGLKDALTMYTSVIRERVGAQRFFLSTEDEQLETGLRALFPGQLMSRNDRLHLQLNEGKTVWGDPDSYTISADHGVDALTDIYLLASLNLVVYHPASTFAEIARHLHGVLQKPQPSAGLASSLNSTPDSSANSSANSSPTAAPTASPTASADAASPAAPTAFERARERFIARATALAPRGAPAHPLQIESGEHGPKTPELTPPAFMYWETLGYRIPFLERLFMGSNSAPHLAWDADLFSALAQHTFEDLPMPVFRKLCPYPEAFSQMSTLRGYISGRKVLIIGSESYWLELLCAMAGAAEVTTVEYRKIQWRGTLTCATPLRTLTWDDYINELDQHEARYDLILSYSSIEHSGLGRYGDRITPLGDLFTFMLMAQAMKPSGMCTAAVPTGQDLTHFNAHRIYGEKRIQAMELASGLKYRGIVYPDADYLATDPVEHLRAGWSLDALAKLPLGTYRQPILCFAGPDFSPQRYAMAA